MGRRKKGHPVHGWVILDKPSGMGSTQAVAKIRYLFDAQKAGHAGTLDPMASGILAVALGKGDQDGPLCHGFRQNLSLHCHLGKSRDSDDAEGTPTGTCSSRPTCEAIEAMLASLCW